MRTCTEKQILLGKDEYLFFMIYASRIIHASRILHQASCLRPNCNCVAIVVIRGVRGMGKYTAKIQLSIFLLPPKWLYLCDFTVQAQCFLHDGTVPSRCFLHDGTVPSRCFLRDGTVPSRCFLSDGTVPSRCFLHDGTVPSYNHYHIGKGVKLLLMAVWLGQS